MSVSPEDIQIALGRTSLTKEESLQWSMWINDARMLVAARLGDLDDLDQARLDYVVREAVRVLVLNPENATQVSETVGDASSSRTYKTGKGRIVILDEWWALLAPDNSSRAFVIDVVGCASVHLPWCDLMFGGTACSCGVDIAGYPIYENYPP